MKIVVVIKEGLQADRKNTLVPDVSSETSQCGPLHQDKFFRFETKYFDN